MTSATTKPITATGLARAVVASQTVRLLAEDAVPSGLAVPITVGLSPIGVLELRGPMVDNVDVDALETMAATAANEIIAVRGSETDARLAKVQEEFAAAELAAGTIDIPTNVLIDEAMRSAGERPNTTSKDGGTADQTSPSM